MLGSSSTYRHTRQARTDLRRQADSLGFPTAKRAAFAIELEIAETDFVQEFQSLPDLAKHIANDLLFGAAERDSEREACLLRKSESCRIG